MKEELGDDWTFPNLFRMGASALLVDIERQLFHHVTGRYAAVHEIPRLFLFHVVHYPIHSFSIHSVS